MAPPSEPLDAFWLPASMRPLVKDLPWEVHDVVAGQAAAPGDGVAVRWPVLGRGELATLLAELRATRSQAVPDLVGRWQRALQAVPGILMEQPDMLEAIACYTGYPSSMMVLAFTQGELMQFDVHWGLVQAGPPLGPGSRCRAACPAGCGSSLHVALRVGSLRVSAVHRSFALCLRPHWPSDSPPATCPATVC